MSDEQQNAEAETHSVWSEYRVMTLIAITVVIAIALSIVGMVLYHVSGTAQIDLSRPGYEGVSRQVDEDVRSFEEYPATGAITEASLDEFEKLYREQLENARAINAFGGDPMAPDTLGIDEPSSN